MTNGQNQALKEILEIEKFGNGLFAIVDSQKPSEPTGFLRLDISLHTGDLDHAPDGISFRARERFLVMIPADFPYKIPWVITLHARFAGKPHVQWARHLCLYQAPDIEWNPSDGMFGFMDRLWRWLKMASLNELDPVGEALHPPATYPQTGPSYYVVPRIDTPADKDLPWCGLARLNIIHDHRVDVDEWSDIGFTDPGMATAACILLAQPMPWEFPSRMTDLVAALAERGVSKKDLFLLLQSASMQNKDKSPLYVLVGTPMRGIRGSMELKQHLTAWRIDPIFATGFRHIVNKYLNDTKLSEIGRGFERIVFQWAEVANVSWCRVLEDRPEIVIRRDHASPMAVFRDKTIAIWGCGALGGHIALHLARAGVAKLILYDDGIVTPGILVRQPYDDADIGKLKAEALADKLRAIRPTIRGPKVEVVSCDVLVSALDCNDWSNGSDIVFDCTATQSVRAKLEKVRKDAPQIPATVISMIVSSEATHGLTVVATSDHTGGAADVYRRAKLDVCRDRSLRHFVDAFFPTLSEDNLFQPEPGCSSPTFVGSSADVSALAALLLNMAGKSLSQHPQSKANLPTAWAHYISQPHAIPVSPRIYKSSTSFAYTPDIVTKDDRHGYEIRTSTQAWKQMEYWIAKSRDKVGPDIETGGLSFGEINDATGVIWVTEVSGPPADSDAGADRFVCGTDGTQAAHKERIQWSRGSVSYVGMWHTHPFGIPEPSRTDRRAMATILSNGPVSPRRSLLSIIGIPHEKPELGTHVFERNDFREGREKTDLSITGPESPQNSDDKSSLRQADIGLALSGGGARAIAFHLGCLRALNKQGTLDQVGIISAVSGGAVLAAMYAYSDDDFSAFDERVCALLRRGLQKDIAKAILNPVSFARMISTILVAGMAAKGTQMTNFTTAAFQKLSKSNRTKRPQIRINPPFLRWASRTTAFETVLRKQLFGSALLNEPRRTGLDVVLNATELRTGTAFRFGSRVSANWRFGTVQEDIPVASAVAASAAFPPLLPALHKYYNFQRNGEINTERVILTDGGVYDNLGASCLDPSRNPNYVAHVYPCERLICCNAGYGQWSGSIVPYGWPSRMRRSVDVMFRKGQDRIVSHLFNQRESGELKGLILPYLGMQDEALQRDTKIGALPEDFVTRNQIIDYPTDFRAMTETDLDLLSRRGEQLTYLLADAYW